MSWIDLDIFWLKDDEVENSTNLPEPDIITREVAEHLGWRHPREPSD